MVTATTYYGTFDQASYNAVSVATTSLVISGITTGLNVSGIATFQNGVNIVGVTTISGELANINCTGIATFAGNVSIAGTLTYEDVTDIDSVGIVTARQLINAQGQVHVGTGVSIKAGGLNVTAGVTTVQALQATTGTFSGDISVNGGDLTVTGGEGISAVLKLSADQGDDNGDGWKVVATHTNLGFSVSTNAGDNMDNSIISEFESIFRSNMGTSNINNVTEYIEFAKSRKLYNMRKNINNSQNQGTIVIIENPDEGDDSLMIGTKFYNDL